MAETLQSIREEFTHEVIKEHVEKLKLATKSLEYITHMHVITEHEKGSLETCAGCAAMRALKELGKL